MVNKSIFVQFRKAGIHCFPGAKDLKGVEYLASPHRHEFWFRVEIDVVHSDRDIEFILFKEELEQLYSGGALKLDFKSCEMMAEELLAYIIGKYPNRKVAITVSEDGENGGIVRYVPE